jgi:hypothetical protein
MTGEIVRISEEYYKAQEATSAPLDARRAAIGIGRNPVDWTNAERDEWHMAATVWTLSEEYIIANNKARELSRKREAASSARETLYETWNVEAERPVLAAAVPFEQALDDLHRELTSTNHAIYAWGALRGAAAGRVKRSFVMKCVETECTGFLSSEYTCGLCDVEVCKECHVKKSAAHVCDAATVATIRHIRKEAHPCPSCSALISKIDGCDQMYCTQCHTAFSWNTGRIETGVVHNPHYYQYMRETGQAAPRRYNPGFACEEVHGIERTLMLLRNRVPAELVNTALEAYRCIIHIREVDLLDYRREQARYLEQEWRRVLRVKRLLNVIDDAKWKTILQREEKSHYKVTAWVHLLEMYTTVSLETLARITRTSTESDFRGFYAECEKAKAYTVEQAGAIAKVFGCVIPKGLRAPLTPVTA